MEQHMRTGRIWELLDAAGIVYEHHEISDTHGECVMTVWSRNGATFRYSEWSDGKCDLSTETHMPDVTPDMISNLIFEGDSGNGKRMLTIQVPIDMDKVQEMVEMEASEMLTDILMGRVRKALPKTFTGDINWREFSSGIIRSMIEDDGFREEAMDRAAEMLVEKVSRTKKWKEKYSEAADLG